MDVLFLSCVVMTACHDDADNGPSASTTYDFLWDYLDDVNYNMNFIYLFKLSYSIYKYYCVVAAGGGGGGGGVGNIWHIPRRRGHDSVCDNIAFFLPFSLYSDDLRSPQSLRSLFRLSSNPSNSLPRSPWLVLRSVDSFPVMTARIICFRLLVSFPHAAGLIPIV